MRRRLDWIDAAKGIAIVGIVAVHASQRVVDIPSLMLRIFGAGRYGVQVFFIVSGYAVLWSLWERSASGADINWGGFYLRRIARVAPVAYLGAMANLFVNGVAVTAMGLTVTALFLQGWDHTFSGLVLGGWVLTVEVAFYALAPLVFRFVKSWRSAAVLAGASVANAIVVKQMAVAFLPAARQEEFLYFWPPTQLPFVAIGVLLFFVCPPEGSGLETLLSGRRRIVTIAVLGGLAVSLHALGSAFLYLAMPALGLLLASKRSEWLFANPVTIWLGRISYSMFIWHFFVLEALQKLFSARLQGATGLLSLYAIGLVVSAAVGHLSSKAVEAPVARLLAHCRPE